MSKLHEDRDKAGVCLDCGWYKREPGKKRCWICLRLQQEMGVALVKGNAKYSEALKKLAKERK